MSSTRSVTFIPIRVALRQMGLPLVAVALLAFLPLLIEYTYQLWSLDHYRFFPLVPLGAAVLAFRGLEKNGSFIPWPISRYLPFVILSLLLAAAAVVLSSPWLAGVGLLVTIAAGILAVGGGRLLRQLFPAWAFLWLAIRLPMGIDLRLISNLQTMTAKWASAILDLLGVLHVMSGNVVELPGQRLLVEEACSGVHSLFATFTTTLFFVLWTNRGIFQSFVLLSSSVVWVLVANALRVIVITVLLSKWGISVTDGWQHELLGLAVFVSTLLLVLSTDRLLLYFAPIRERSTTESSKSKVRHEIESKELGSNFEIARTSSSRLASWSMTSAYSILVLIQIWIAGAGLFTTSTRSPSVTSESLGEQALPENWQGWQRVNFSTAHRERNSADGEFSQIWRYKAGQHLAIFSLDYPFVGWHELPVCYTSNGWRVENRVVRLEKTQAGIPCEFVELDLSKPEIGKFAYLLFTLFDAQQQPVEVPSALKHGLRYRLEEFTQRLSGKAAKQPFRQQTFQVQTFVEGFVPINSADRQKAQAFFHQTSQLISSRWKLAKGP